MAQEYPSLQRLVNRRGNNLSSGRMCEKPCYGHTQLLWDRGMGSRDVQHTVYTVATVQYELETAVP